MFAFNALTMLFVCHENYPACSNVCQ